MTVPNPALVPWPYPTLFAHRGGGRHAPENTLAAMKCARAHDFSAVEFDVKLSRDGVALLMHDDTLERTTNGQGPVAALDMAELELLDAGSWHGGAFAREPVPRFSAVARYLHGLGLFANIELKPCPGRAAETGRLVAELVEELWSDRRVKPLLSSFDASALRAARTVAPALPLGVLREVPDNAAWALAGELGAVSMHCDEKSADAAQVRRAHAQGLRLLVYTVNDAERARQLLHLGVDGIFTDELETMGRLYPACLADAGKPMADPIDDQLIDWTIVPPPMP